MIHLLTKQFIMYTDTMRGRMDEKRDMVRVLSTMGGTESLSVTSLDNLPFLRRGSQILWISLLSHGKRTQTF